MKLPRAHHLPIDLLIGQVIMPALNIKFLNRDAHEVRRILQYVRKFHVGGFILFGGNPTDVNYWVRRLEDESKLPLLFAADLERGVGSIFQQGTIFPHLLSWGATNNLTLISEAANAIASEAKAIGINTIFAPVLDLVTESDNPIINIRGFHSDPQKIAEFAKIFCLSIQKNGIACVAKHFPGHGKAKTDSHLEMPIINASFSDLVKNDILPFKESVESGIKGLMIAHIQFKDTKLPATFQHKILSKYLRNQLKFSGITFSDALNMKAITNNFSIPTQVELGLKAGLDIFLMPKQFPLFYNSIKYLVEKNENLKENLEKSVERIFLLKKWIHKSNYKITHHSQIYKFLEKPNHIHISNSIADKAVTCIHKSSKFPPDLRYIKKCFHFIHTDFELKKRPLENFQKKIVGFFDEAETTVNKTIQENKSFSQYENSIIILSLYSRTFGGHISHFDWKMINKNYSKILENNIPIIIFIFGNPYSSLKIKRLSESSAVFLLYSYVYSSQRAAFKALCSSIEICGKLPINLKYQKKEVTENIIPARKYTLVTKSDSFREFVEIDTYIKQSIHKKIFPGGVLLIAHNGEIIYHKSYGYYDYNSDSEIVQTDTPYDIASLTKVLATTPAILKLYDKNQLDLNQPLSDFYPNLYKKNLGSATINDLLLHQSGLPAWKPLYKSSKTKDQLIENVLLTKLEHKRKEKCVYSDLGFILLGDLIEKITGYSLDTFCRDYLFNPLGLKSIRYISLLNYERTITKTKKLFPPTGLDEYRKRIIQGEVHDTNAWLMGGIAGHAGLFSEAKDVAAMGQLFINNGIYNARRVLRYKAIQLTLTNQSPKISNRFLGWDTPSPKSSSGKYLSKGSFGHLAFTGPSIWIDSDRQLIITFLCNRTHPNPQANQMKSFRPRLHDIIIEALKANNLIK